MPIYEYRCRACGHEFELWQKISERPKRTCSKCRKRTAERQISLTSFSLKGGGWYADGYASTPSGTSSEGSGGGSSEAKSRSKGAKKRADGGGSGAANAA